MITLKELTVILYFYLTSKEHLFMRYSKNNVQNQPTEFIPTIICANTQHYELHPDPDKRDWEYDGYGVPRYKDTFLPK